MIDGQGQSRVSSSTFQRVNKTLITQYLSIPREPDRSMMGRIFHPLFALLTSATRQELSRQVAYLKEENRILRAPLPELLVATPQERHRLRNGPQSEGVLSTTDCAADADKKNGSLSI
jgi:hypothetical protein